MQYMKATPIARAREVRDDGSIVEVVTWELPEPVPPCVHKCKYILLFGTTEQARVRYDNERGKGDHRHVAGRDEPYVFLSIDHLLDNFERDIQEWSAT